MQGPERVMREMKAKLQADLPAKIAELNAEFNDDVQLGVPAEASYKFMWEPSEQSLLEAISYPAVVLRPVIEDPVGGPDIGDEYTIAEPIEVAFMVGYDVSERQGMALLRYMRAAKEILAPQTSLDCGSVEWGGGGLARVWTTDNGVIRDAAHVFTVTVHETP